MAMNEMVCAEGRGRTTISIVASASGEHIGERRRAMTAPTALLIDEGGSDREHSGMNFCIFLLAQKQSMRHA